MEVNENEGYLEDKSGFSDSEFQELVCKYKFYSNIQYVLFAPGIQFAISTHLFCVERGLHDSYIFFVTASNGVHVGLCFMCAPELSIYNLDKL